MRLKVTIESRLGKVQKESTGEGGLVVKISWQLKERSMVFSRCVRWFSGALHCCLSFFFSFCNIDDISVTFEIFLNYCCNG